MTTAQEKSTLTIRAPQPKDYARMAGLAAQLGYASEASQIAKRVSGMESSRDHAAFVAELPSGEIAGWIGIFIYRCLEADARAEISGLVVDGSLRSQGIGRGLLDRAEQWARENGCAAIGLRSNVIRDRAHAFYERLGYRHIKTQKSFRKDL